MGFELEDCQAAVENGKLSVDEAVEWLVLCSCAPQFLFSDFFANNCNALQ